MPIYSISPNSGLRFPVLYEWQPADAQINCTIPYSKREFHCSACRFTLLAIIDERALFGLNSFQTYQVKPDHFSWRTWSLTAHSYARAKKKDTSFEINTPEKKLSGGLRLMTFPKASYFAMSEMGTMTLSIDSVIASRHTQTF